MKYHEQKQGEFLAQVRKEGDLKEYSDEELLTIDLAAFWRKPR